MKSVMLLVPFVLAVATPVLSLYTPPTDGGPGSSRGSGTRMLRPNVWMVPSLPEVAASSI